MFWKEDEKTISASSVVKTYTNDIKEVTHKWIRKIEQGDILELDETRMKMDFMILRSKLDFISRLGLLDSAWVITESLDELEEKLNEKIKKVIIRMFTDKVIDALKKPLFK